LLFLLTDNGSTFQPAYLGSSVVLSNSRCSIDVVNSSVEPAGSGLSLSLSVTFFPAWSGANPYIFMSAQGTDNYADFTFVGFWSIP